METSLAVEATPSENPTPRHPTPRQRITKGIGDGSAGEIAGPGDEGFPDEPSLDNDKAYMFGSTALSNRDRSVDTSVKNSPVEEAPVEEAPVEKAPVKDSPVKEAPVDVIAADVVAVDDSAVEKLTGEKLPRADEINCAKETILPKKYALTDGRVWGADMKRKTDVAFGIPLGENIAWSDEIELEDNRLDDGAAAENPSRVETAKRTSETTLPNKDVPNKRRSYADVLDHMLGTPPRRETAPTLKTASSNYKPPVDKPTPSIKTLPPLEPAVAERKPPPGRTAQAEEAIHLQDTVTADAEKSSSSLTNAPSRRQRKRAKPRGDRSTLLDGDGDDGDGNGNDRHRPPIDKEKPPILSKLKHTNKNRLPVGTLSAKEIISSEELVATKEPVAATEPVLPEEPGVAKEPVSPEEPVAPEEPIAPEEPAAPEEPGAAKEPIAPEEPIAPKEPGVAAIAAEGRIAPKKPVSPDESPSFQELDATKEFASTNGTTLGRGTAPRKSANFSGGNEHFGISGASSSRPTPSLLTPVEPAKIHRVEMKDASTNTAIYFIVDNRAMRVLTILFSGYLFNRILYTPSLHKSALAWADFVYAMRQLGFAAESLYGSAWLFYRGNNDLGPPTLIFHEPAPGQKVSNVEARRWGDRLWKLYGWNRSTFLQMME